MSACLKSNFNGGAANGNEGQNGSLGANSEVLSDRLLNALQTSIIFCNSEGAITRANSRALDDLRVSERIIGSNITEIMLVVSKGRDVLPELIASASDPSRKEEAEMPSDAFIDSPAGKTRFFARGKIVGLERGGYLISFINVEDQLTQEYVFKMALSSTKIFPWFYDMERNTMVIDPRYFAYTGIPTKDNTMTLEEFSTRLHPDDQKDMATAFEQQLNGIHYPYPVPFRLRMGDGRYEWFEGQSTYLGRINGVPYRVVGICMSTQAHKDIEQALIVARDKAQQSDRLKSAFLANMSHEIRTPLNAIIGFSNLLTNGEVSPDSKEGKEYGELIDTNCNHLLAIISDILDLSRIETGTMEYSFSTQSLRQIMLDLYQVHRLSVQENVTFNLKLPDGDIRIDTDPIRLRQVFNNLVSNAVKFTCKGRIEIGYQATEDGENVELFVEDTGCGIPEGQIPKIFERFYKVDTFVQGAGLGLSICKTIVEHLGGTIGVSSCPKKGSRFTVCLPVERKR